MRGANKGNMRGPGRGWKRIGLEGDEENRNRRGAGKLRRGRAGERAERGARRDSEGARGELAGARRGLRGPDTLRGRCGGGSRSPAGSGAGVAGRTRRGDGGCETSMAMAVAAVAAAEAARAAEAAMAAPTSPSNLRSSRRNAQPIPARAPLRSANRSAEATKLCPPSD